tara:strand:- start:528 stop:887 length:360 start_codon:yes stop_codon:yes gene_type:complete
MKGNNHARSRDIPVTRQPRSGDGTFVKRSNIIVNQEGSNRLCREITDRELTLAIMSLSPSGILPKALIGESQSAQVLPFWNMFFWLHIQTGLFTDSIEDTDLKELDKGLHPRNVDVLKM